MLELSIRNTILVIALGLATVLLIPLSPDNPISRLEFLLKNNGAQLDPKTNRYFEIEFEKEYPEDNVAVYIKKIYPRGWDFPKLGACPYYDSIILVVGYLGSSEHEMKIMNKLYKDGLIDKPKEP